MTITDDIFDGYHCVFTGRPQLCTPYAMFATEGQAKIFSDEIESRHPIITLAEWREIYQGGGRDDA